MEFCPQWHSIGVKCIMLLTDLMTKLGAEDIVSACQKQPSFAGFWYETKFFMHHKGHSLINVNCINPSEGKSELKLTITKGVPLDTSSRGISLLERGVLYELRASNPTVDGVALLKDDRNLLACIYSSFITST